MCGILENLTRKLKKYKKIEKKVLTNKKQHGILTELSGTTEKLQKKDLKNFKKVLDKSKMK